MSSSEIGIPGLKGGDPVQWGIPNVTLINYSGIGDDTEGPYANDNNTLQFVDNFSWIHGKHTFRFGGEFRREHYNQVGNQFARGQFTFQPNATQNPVTKTGGDTFADYLLGDSTSPKPPSPSPAPNSCATAGPSTSTTPGRSPRSSRSPSACATNSRRLSTTRRATSSRSTCRT